jgi:hypothetical protein
MSALPGVYYMHSHDRKNDWETMIGMAPYAVLILQPSWNIVSRVWTNVRPKYIILRSWDLDDGRSDSNPDGVYRRLEIEPDKLGRDHVNEWIRLFRTWQADASRNGKAFPELKDVIFHMVNEPDTNTMMKQINDYSVSAMIEANKYPDMSLGIANLSTGHPAHLIAPRTPNWLPMSPTLERLEGSRHWLFLHEYFNSKGMKDADVYPWHINRHTMSDFLLRHKIKIAITEWGNEELLNGITSHPKGWLGIWTAKQYADFYLDYCKDVHKHVKFVLPFGLDHQSRDWASHDISSAGQDFVRVSRILHDLHKEEPDVPNNGPTVPIDRGLVWPLARLSLSQRFGENYQTYWDKYKIPGHNGIDFAGNIGDSIYAISGGVVEWIGVDPDYGNYVRIYHPELGVHSFYAHLDHVLVRGHATTVTIGQEIAKVGNTGNSTGPHLHFEIRIGDNKNGYRNVHYGHKKGRSNPESFYALHGKYLWPPFW